MEVIEETDETFVFTAPCNSRWEANQIRRILLQDVTGLAIDLVTFDCNTTILSDEILAHRMGLLVARTANFETLPTLELSFKVEGPGWFTTRNFELPELFLETKIVYLQEGQTVEGRVTIRPGTPREHAKWSQVVTVMFYQQLMGYRFVVETIGWVNIKRLLKETQNILNNAPLRCS